MSSAGCADTQPNLETIRLAGQDNIIAKAGGGQSQNTLTQSISMHRITTVATIGDSVTMPPAQAGRLYALTNATSNSANVFPFRGDSINALGANNAFALAAGKVAIFVCVTDGQWHTVLTA